jgi:hypothetical protein
MNKQRLWTMVNPPRIVERMPVVTFKLAEVDFAPELDNLVRPNPFIRGCWVDVRSPVPLHQMRAGEAFELMRQFQGWLAKNSIATSTAKITKAIQVIPTTSHLEYLSGYSILNFTRLVDCVDMPQQDVSQCANRTGPLKLRMNKIPDGVEIFRIKKPQPYVAVLDEMRKKLIDVGVPFDYFDESIFDAT